MKLIARLTSLEYSDEYKVNFADELNKQIALHKAGKVKRKIPEE